MISDPSTNTSPAIAETNTRSKVLTALAIGAALLIFADTLVILYVCYSPVPWNDMWNYWRWTFQYPRNFLWHLAAQNNEHRILVPRLFFLLDQYCFGGTAKSLAVVIPAIQLAHAWAFWRLASKVRAIRPSTLWFLSAAALASMFAIQQFANFTWYFQINFVGVYFGATISCLALLKLSESKDTLRPPDPSSFKHWLVFTIVLAVFTTYCMANGLIIWPVLISLAISLSLGRRVYVILSASGIVSWILYFIGYVRPHDHPPPLMALFHLPAFLRFFLMVVGSPFSDVITGLTGISNVDNVATVAAFLGGAALLLGCSLLILQARNRRAIAPRLRQTTVLIYWHLFAFTLASIALIAAGRFTFPIAEGLTSRYTTPALFYWLLLLSLITIALEHATFRTAQLAEFCVRASTIAILTLFLIFNQPARLAYARGYQQYLDEAESAIANNVFDAQSYQRVNYYDMPGLLKTAQKMAAKDLSVFHQPWHRWLGDPVTQHFSVASPNPCQGVIDKVLVVQSGQMSGYRIQGWGWDGRTSLGRKHILFADADGRLIGSGLGGFWRPDVAVGLRQPGASQTGWMGYVSGLNHGNKISAYLMLWADRVCEIGSGTIHLNGQP